MSSASADECERYKDFLATSWLDWMGKPKAHRRSSRQRPFAGPLPSESQRYPALVLRVLFE